MIPVDTAWPREMVPLADLTPHPSNYKGHPEDQVEHIAAAIRQYGVYRNIVVAKDNTILAGHGVAAAARRVGLEEIEVVRLPFDPDSPEAIKLLTLDNEVARIAEVDDRALSELLRRIKDESVDGLLGTGYDEMMLANLVLVTRPSDEIRSQDDAAAWVGLPEFTPGAQRIMLNLAFDSEAERQELLDQLGITTVRPSGTVLSAWWPPRDRDDARHLMFDG